MGARIPLAEAIGVTKASIARIRRADHGMDGSSSGGAGRSARWSRLRSTSIEPGTGSKFGSESSRPDPPLARRRLAVLLPTMATGARRMFFFWFVLNNAPTNATGTTGEAQ